MSPSVPTHHEHRSAYFTLFSNDAYLPGILCLHHSLQRVNSSYPLVILTTPSVSPQYIQQLQSLHGCIIRYSSPPLLIGIVNHSNYARPLYAECWTKLRMWEAEEYERIVYLDADMVVLRNIDHLFDICCSDSKNGEFYAVGDCYGGRLEAKERDACCFFDSNTTKPEYFNAGFCVLTPNKGEYQRMLAALPTWPERETSRFSEQDFLNYYYKDTWKHLPYTYNAQKRIKVHHPNLWDLQQIHVVHYVDEKPWSHRWAVENIEYREEVELWWDIYADTNQKLDV